MKCIKQTYRIKAPMNKVWQALVDPEIIKKWSGAPAVMDDKVGSEFSLWNGDIVGKNIEVVNPPAGGKKLVQDWQEKNWSSQSKVTFTLQEEDGLTTVELLHENVPENRYQSINQGWRQYYLGPMKEFLESK
jgi:activator of HSP90 ATPase